jgi:4'-phosphopantetheinyl transferase
VNPRRLAWNKFNPEYELADNEVHVWRISLVLASAGFAKLRQILSPDERERADRFHFEVDRRRSIIGRGCLRLLLARILASPPDTLEIKYDEFGKPCLSAKHTALQFNVSHSGDVILIAIARGRAVGVDVEKIRTDLELDGIAARFFSINECKVLTSLVGPARYRAFFTCWTRKEAYVKARGIGLSLPLDQFDVSFLPHEEPKLLETRGEPADAKRWQLRALDPCPGHIATLAAAGANWTLRCWDWKPELLMGSID